LATLAAIVSAAGDADVHCTGFEQFTRHARMHLAMAANLSTSFGTAGSISPLAGSIRDLYAVYLEIAKQDHACRIAALYGKQLPPAGHTPFRPLPFEHFEARYKAVLDVPAGDEIFRKQLARQARVYGVEAASESNRRAA